MPPYEIAKWEVVSVYFHDLPKPHDKFCICVCPKTGLFLFVNSDPPYARKAKEVALELSNFEATFIHHTSYIDTTRLEPINTDDRVNDALRDDSRCKGLISPSLKKRILAAVVDHGALPDIHHALVIENENLA